MRTTYGSRSYQKGKKSPKLSTVAAGSNRSSFGSGTKTILWNYTILKLNKNETNLFFSKIHLPPQIQTNAIKASQISSHHPTVPFPDPQCHGFGRLQWNEPLANHVDGSNQSTWCPTTRPAKNKNTSVCKPFQCRTKKMEQVKKREKKSAKKARIVAKN